MPVYEITPYGKNYIKNFRSINATQMAEWSGLLDSYAWTVDSQDGWVRMQWYPELAGIITNNPGAYRAWAASYTCQTAPPDATAPTQPRNRVSAVSTSTSSRAG
jgi:hypothetical protein